MQRRSLLLSATALLGATTLAARAATPTTKTDALAVMQVWKDPNCGCCKDWIAYLQRDGFQVQVFEPGNTAMRQRLGLPVGARHPRSGDRSRRRATRSSGFSVPTSRP